jgi:hypothetical protein
VSRVRSWEYDSAGHRAGDLEMRRVNLFNRGHCFVINFAGTVLDRLEIEQDGIV